MRQVIQVEECEELGWEHLGAHWFNLREVSGNLGYWCYVKLRLWDDNSFIKGYRYNPNDIGLLTQEQEFLFQGKIRNKADLEIIMELTNLI